MDNPVLVPFKIAHFDRIRLRPMDALGVQGIPNLRERLIRVALMQMAVSGLAGDEVVFCGGLLTLWPGVEEAWLLTSPLVEKYPVWFHRTVDRYLHDKEIELGLRRIQMTVHQDHETGKRWAERLGFACEARMAKYGPQGHDYYLYARTK